MTIEHIRAQLAKQATIFQTGGIRPTHDLLEAGLAMSAGPYQRSNHHLAISRLLHSF